MNDKGIGKGRLPDITKIEDIQDLEEHIEKLYLINDDVIAHIALYDNVGNKTIHPADVVALHKTLTFYS